MAYNQFSRGTGNRGGQYSGGGSGQRGGMPQAKTEKKVFKPLTEENYVELAEAVILEMQKEEEQAEAMGARKLPKLTTSKIRNLLAMSMDIYNDVLERKEEKLDRDLLGRINYLKVRMVYEAGREDAVRRFVDTANLVKYITEIKDSKQAYLLFSRYMEALVAYHRFHGGKD